MEPNSLWSLKPNFFNEKGLGSLNPSFPGQHLKSSQFAFKNANPTTNSLLFGHDKPSFVNNANPVPIGTKIPLKPTTGIEQGILVKFNCITTMKEYETKSLEELRWDDYQNFKGDASLVNVGSYGPSINNKIKAFGKNTNATLTNQTTFGKNTQVPATINTSFNQNQMFSSGNIPVKNDMKLPFGQYPNGGLAYQTNFGIQTETPASVNTTFPNQNAFGGNKNFSFGNASLNNKVARSTVGSPFTQTTATSNFFRNQPFNLTTSITPQVNNTIPVMPSSFTQQTTNQLFNGPSSLASNYMPTSCQTSGGFQNILQQSSQNNKEFLQSQFNSLYQPQVQGAQSCSGGFKGIHTTDGFKSLSTGNFNTCLQNAAVLFESSGVNAPEDLHEVVEKVYESFPHRDIFDNIDGNKYTNISFTNFPFVPLESTKSFPTVDNKIKATTLTPKVNYNINITNKHILLSDTVNEASKDPGLIFKNTKHLFLKKHQQNYKDIKDCIIEEYNMQIGEADLKNSDLNSTENKKLKRMEIPSKTSSKPNNSSFQEAGTRENNESYEIVESEITNKHLSLFTCINEDINKNVKQLEPSNIPNSLENMLNLEAKSILLDTCEVKLTRIDYYTIPSLNDIHKFRNGDRCCLIKDFVIGRHGFGKICFPDEIDVFGLDLDAIVTFAFREVIVYPNESLKPPVGKGLNRLAEITLDNIWPRNNTKGDFNENQTDFIKRLILLSEKQNAKFVNYFHDRGQWVFVVEHFTRYYFDEEFDKEIAEKLFRDRDIRIYDNNEEIAKDLIIESKEYEVTDSELLIKNDSKTLHVLTPILLNDICLYKSFDDEDNLPLCTPLDHHTRTYRKIKIHPRNCQLMNPYCNVYINNSTFSSCNYMDMMLFKRNSFKVGWGLNNSFVMLNSNANENLDARSRITIMKIISITEDSLEMNLEHHLNAVFKECTITIDAFGLPFCSVNQNCRLLILHQTVASDFDRNNKKGLKYCSEIWNLCHALWGPNSTSPTSQNSLFSKWLEECTSTFTYNKLGFSIINDIFTCLTEHKIKKATELAIANGYPQLSLLLAQTNANEDFRMLMYQQIKQSYDNGSLKGIEKDVVKVYSLLAGIDNISGIDIYKELDWKHTLAIYMWYKIPLGTSFKSAIQEYNNSFTCLNCNNYPLANYCTNLSKIIFDTLYQIMLLSLNLNQFLYKVIDPSGYTDDALDYRLSWLLLQVFISLEVGIVSEEVVNATHLSFASQLQSLGMWKWSVFVLLFVRDSSVRTHEIQRVLNTCDINEDIEDFFVNKLHIPSDWIHAALIVQSDLLKDNLQNFEHYVFSNDWCKAHKIAVDVFVAEFILMDQNQMLHNILNLLTPGKNNIMMWSTQIGLILDILEMSRDIYNLYSITPIEMSVLRRNITELCNRINYFPLKTVKHSFAISKFSKLLALFIKMAYFELPKVALETIPEFGYLICRLPMPSDYKYDELLKCLYYYVAKENYP